MKTNSITIYHHDDPDGYFGAAMCQLLANDMFGSKDVNNLFNFQELSYPKVFPIDTMKKDDIVYIVDVSFGENTFNQLKQVCSKAKQVYWIDHHATSKDEVVPLLEKEPIENLKYYVNTKYCGCLNAYLVGVTNLFESDRYANLMNNLDSKMLYRENGTDFYREFPDSNYNFESKIDTFVIGAGKKDVKSERIYITIPKFLVMIDDYDCHKLLFKLSDYFTYGIRNEPLEKYIELVNYLYKSRKNEEYATEYAEVMHNYISNGKAIVEFLKSDYNNEIKNSFVFDFSEYGGPEKVLCMNSRGNSWVFSNYFDEYDMCCLFHFDKDKWTYSIYANDEAMANGLDCSKIAKVFGGGGHPGASGFSTEKLIFNK